MGFNCNGFVKFGLDANGVVTNEILLSDPSTNGLGFELVAVW